MILTVTTDWISAFAAIGQLFITGVGFWLLYTTFVLQAKVATDQQKMLEIESRRVRRVCYGDVDHPVPGQIDHRVS